MTDLKSVCLAGGFALASQVLVAGEPLFTATAGGMGCKVESLNGSDDARFHVRGVSDDGEWLAYTEEYGKTEDGKPIRTIFLLNLQSGKKTPFKGDVTNSGAFSPDGLYMVAAFETDSDRTDILEINLKTQEMKQIAYHEQWDWLPSYSPDGKNIVFNSWRVEQQSEVHVYERATETLTRITTNPAYDAHAEYSPDGSKILFHRMMAKKDDGSYDFELFVIDVESGEETQLTKGSPHEESYASWAPDSEHVVFSSDHDGKPSKHNLYVLGPCGGIVSRLTKGDWKDSYAYWTRDGHYIYFTSERTGKPNIHRIPMNGLDCQRF